MSKSTSLKEAIAKWEQKNEKKASEAKEVKLYGMIPPIDRMDSSLSILVNCEKLSLSTNCIEKIANLNGLKHLKILSLARNNIKSLTGLDAVADTLEELWLSYNIVDKLKGIGSLKKLRVFYLANNNVKEWVEFGKMAELPLLSELVFLGNPLEEIHSQAGDWREIVAHKLPKLKKLDGVPVLRDRDADEDD